MARLEAVVERSHDATFSLWKIAPPAASPFIRLWRGMSDEEVGTVVAEFIQLEEITSAVSPTVALQKVIESESLILAGGIRAVEEDKHIEINPGCCCGLEGWRQWLYLNEGDYCLWLGHDTSPWVERIGNGYRVWIDSWVTERSLNGLSFIDFSPEELNQSLQQVSADLLVFLSRLTDWANRIEPTLAGALVTKIDKELSISAPKLDR